MSNLNFSPVREISLFLDNFISSSKSTWDLVFYEEILYSISLMCSGGFLSFYIE